MEEMEELYKEHLETEVAMTEEKYERKLALVNKVAEMLQDSDSEQQIMKVRCSQSKEVSQSLQKRMTVKALKEKLLEAEKKYNVLDAKYQDMEEAHKCSFGLP